MTDSQTPVTKPGPANPGAKGPDAPTPPEGPLRQDDLGAGEIPAGHDDEASGSETNDKHASETGGHTIPLEDEQPDAHSDLSENDVQVENAETSLDQPSEG